MKHAHRAVKSMFGIAMAATALAGFAAPTASATTTHVTASCYGLDCYTYDPIDKGCSADAYTAESMDTVYGTIELRYSPACAANWARISGASNGQLFWVENIRGEWMNWDAIGSTGYGNMVDGTIQARACVADSSHCTGWH
ncbi:DUF2690 domain-containing protein [Kitasatospora sp. NPDC058218]|uniref:DUF2690 domain-containing protein n=1 Tax=Kitasatospora sp. NPDC058218 TaxID=3346385 RepID=UPI0036D92619